jgi:hypothetical protein
VQVYLFFKKINGGLFYFSFFFEWNQWFWEHSITWYVLWQKKNDVLKLKANYMCLCMGLSVNTEKKRRI